VEQAAERAVAMGQQTYRTDLGFIRLVISKMGALPGQRMLILISPGFLTPSEDAMALASQVLEMAARDNVIIKPHRVVPVLRCRLQWDSECIHS
jgi:hypothetical protein